MISWTSTPNLVEMFQFFAALQRDFFFIQIGSRTTSPSTCGGRGLGDLRCPLPTSPKICKWADLRTSSQASACGATAMTCKQGLSWSCSWLSMITIQCSQPLQLHREARCIEDFPPQKGAKLTRCMRYEEAEKAKKTAHHAPLKAQEAHRSSFCHPEDRRSGSILRWLRHNGGVLKDAMRSA